MTPAAVVDGVHARAASEGFALDPGQEAALPLLARLVAGVDPAPSGGAAHGSTAGRRRGAYLCGPPGRGKTWLVDAVLAVAAPSGVLRAHLVELYARLHVAAAPRGAFVDALPRVLDGVRLLVLDDLHLADSDDTWIVERVLCTVLDAGGAVVVTSNTSAEDLHAGSPHAAGLRRLLRERTAVLALDGARDHRADRGAGADRPGFSSGSVLEPGGSLADAGLERPGPEERTLLTVGGRPLRVLASRPDEVWLPFASVCAGPTAAADLLELATRGTWVLVGVPPLQTCPPDTRSRLLTLVDVAHDRDVRLVLVLRQDLGTTLQHDDPLPGWPRLVSRLQLLHRPGG